jgi:hypothetical protein
MAEWHPFVHYSSAGCSSFKTFPNSEEGEKFYTSNKNHQPTIRTAEGVCRPFWYAESSYGICLFIAALIVEGWLEESLPVKSRWSQCVLCVCVCVDWEKINKLVWWERVFCGRPILNRPVVSRVCKLEEWVNPWLDWKQILVQTASKSTHSSTFPELNFPALWSWPEPH